MAGSTPFWKTLSMPSVLRSQWKGGSGGLLDAVVGPQNLLNAVELDDVAGFVPGVLRSETAVSRRMPVLTGYDKVKARYESIRDGNDFVPVRNRQGSAGHEVIL